MSYSPVAMPPRFFWFLWCSLGFLQPGFWLSELHELYFCIAAVLLALGMLLPCTQVRAMKDLGDDVSQLSSHSPRFQLLCTWSAFQESLYLLSLSTGFRAWLYALCKASSTVISPRPLLGFHPSAGHTCIQWKLW